MEGVNKTTRLSVDEYFLKIALVVAERSTCRHHRVGVIAVKDEHILAIGYNSVPSGFRNCLELGCLRDELSIPAGRNSGICRAVHAEQNVIIQATRHGVSLEGSTIYATHTPCIICARMLVNAKIKRFVSCGEYVDPAFTGLFSGVGIEIDMRERPSLSIEYLA